MSKNRKNDEKKIVRERPLSPHLTVYKPQITSVLSITHRATGVFLFLGAFVLVWWIAAVACSLSHYNFLVAIISSPIGKIFLFGWTFSLFFHMSNGIRHLCWDAGLGYELSTVTISGWAVISFSVFATIMMWSVV